jgi:hypothetical protein
LFGTDNSLGGWGFDIQDPLGVSNLHGSFTRFSWQQHAVQVVAAVLAASVAAEFTP